MGTTANKRTINVVKIEIECPDGQLENPTAGSPMIVKSLWLNMVAGLGTYNNSLNPLKSTRDTNDADNNASPRVLCAEFVPL